MHTPSIRRTIAFNRIFVALGHSRCLIVLGIIVALTMLSARANCESIAPSNPQFSGVETGVYIGGGVYQDIQVPVNDSTGARADGTAPGLEQAEHYGIPLRLEIAKNLSRESWSINTKFSYLYMNPLINPVGASQSSFSVTKFGIYPSYNFLTGTLTQSISLGGEISRLAFMNISTGHLLDAALPVLAWAVGVGDGWRIQVQGAKSVVTAFRYDNGIGLVHPQVDESQATVAEIAVSARYAIATNVWMHLGLSTESVTVDIKDINRYDRFNLDIFTFGDSSRHYNLSTKVLTFGLDKRF